MLEKLKECVKKLRAPQEMVSSIRKALVDSEIIAQGQLEGGEWDEAFLALKVTCFTGTKVRILTQKAVGVVRLY